MNTLTTDIVAVTERAARVELGRFFRLHADRIRQGNRAFLPMFSERIDAAWHQLTADPAAYAAFCAEHAGAPVTHVSTMGKGAVPWIAEYEERFGMLPVVWFASASGTIDQAAYDLYREHGRVEASWNCGPGGGDDSVTPPEQGSAT